MDHLRTESYRAGEYLAASRLFYLFEDGSEKNQSVDELVTQGFVSVAANGAIGITDAGESWNRSGRP